MVTNFARFTMSVDSATSISYGYAIALKLRDIRLRVGNRARKYNFSNRNIRDYPQKRTEKKVKKRDAL